MAPEITSNLKDTETIEGASAKFSCKIDAKAEVEITWLKDGQEITSNKNFKVKFDGSKCSLTVKETALEDAGMYMCRVASLHGSVETSAGLKVLILPWQGLATFLTTPCHTEHDLSVF